MNKELQRLATEYRLANEAFKVAEKTLKDAKGRFIDAMTQEFGPSGVGTVDTDDGYTVGRTWRDGQTTFDWEKFQADHPDVAEAVSVRQLDTTLLEYYVEKNPEARPWIEKYTVVSEPSAVMMPVRQTKVHE